MQDDAQKILAEEILADARKRAERTAARAQAEAEKIHAEAAEAAHAEAEKILSDARGRAEKRRQMVLRTVSQEVIRRKLRAREALIHQAIEQATARLQELPEEPLRRSLFRLACLAIREMPADQVVLKMRAMPPGILNPHSLVSELEQALRAEGRDIAIQIETHPDYPAGVVIESGDGKLRWDNTYGARLKRLEADVRRAIAAVLFEES